jgi:hypothetical protein
VRAGRIIASAGVTAVLLLAPSFSDAQWYPPYALAYDVSSSLRLQVEPRETEVFIDGYYAGTVDEFDCFFQRLRIEPGEHAIELYLPGHRSFQRKLYLQPGRTFRIRHELERLAPGEAEPIKPIPQQPATARPQRPAPRVPPVVPRP